MTMPDDISFVCVSRCHRRWFTRRFIEWYIYYDLILTFTTDTRIRARGYMGRITRKCIKRPVTAPQIPQILARVHGSPKNSDSFRRVRCFKSVIRVKRRYLQSGGEICNVGVINSLARGWEENERSEDVSKYQCLPRVFAIALCKKARTARNEI